MQKPVVWMRGEVRTPPFSKEARLEAGQLLRRLQSGETLSLPHSRPMPSIDRRCRELRVVDRDQTWQIIYALEPEAVVILDVFSKKTPSTPKQVIDASATRLRNYREAG